MEYFCNIRKTAAGVELGNARCVGSQILKSLWIFINLFNLKGYLLLLLLPSYLPNLEWKLFEVRRLGSLHVTFSLLILNLNFCLSTFYVNLPLERLTNSFL